RFAVPDQGKTVCRAVPDRRGALLSPDSAVGGRCFVKTYRATFRYADMSARKIRPFATLIRGRMADEALELLRFLPNKSARILEQVLKSALGNAEDRGAHDIDELVVVESRVDGGPIMKRIMPRA